MKRRSISFYLNFGFVLVLAAVLIFIGVAGRLYIYQMSIQNTIERMEIALENAEGLLYHRREVIRVSLEETIRPGDVDELIESRDRVGLDSLLSRIDAANTSDSYFLVVNEYGTILSSRQEAVGQVWGLSYLLGPLREGGTTVVSSEVLPSACVRRCSQAFQDRVLITTHAGTAEDVTEAYIDVVVVPVRNDEGKLVGALVGGYLINNNRELAEEYTSHVPNTYLSVGGLNGIRILSNIAVDDFSFLEGTMQSEEYVNQLASGERWRGVELMSDGREGVVAADPVYNYRGEIVGNIGVGAPVFTLPTIPTATVTFFLAIMIGLFIAAVMTMRLLTNMVVRPLAQLQGIAKTISTEKAIPDGTAIEGAIVPVEIDNLASDIFLMAEQITHENVELERRVAERTIQLDNTIVELRNASKHKSQFLANISHELRTPLNSIIGFASLLKDRVPGPLNATQDRYTDVIIESGNHLLDMINDILKLVKMDTGADKPSPAPLNLPLLVSTASTSVYPFFNEKRQALVVDIQDEESVPIVGWDEKMIRQTVLNLLVNASKFTPEAGTVTVHVQAAGDDVEIDVVDTGVGIPDEMKERVFLAFEQADNSYTRLYKGVGLGLAITKSIVEMHKGKVWLEDNPDGGTKVRLRIPVDPFGVLDESDSGSASAGRDDL